MQLSSERFRLSFLVFVFAGLTWGVAASALAAKSAPTILHTPRECFPRDQHALLKATVEPDDGSETVRLYFRAGQSKNYQFVEMAEAGGTFQTVLPIPSPTTRHVIYFIEARHSDSAVTRTDEVISNVVRDSEECEQSQPGGTYYVGDSPDIVVVGNGGPSSFPPGFETDGILNVAPPARTVSSATAASSGGGGVGKKTVIAIGAAGAAALGIGLLATNSGDSSTDGSTPDEPPEEPTEPLAPVIACFDAPATATTNEAIRLDASCSEPRGELEYTWDLGDGRFREGRVVNLIYQEPGVYAVKLTVNRIGGSDPSDEAVLIKDIRVTAASSTGAPGPFPPAGTGADLSVVISDSVGPIISDGVVRFLVTHIVTVINRGPSPATGVSLATTSTAAFPILSLDAVGGSCSVTGTAVSCDLGALPPGGAANVSLGLVLSPTAVGTTVTTTAQVSGSPGDPNPGNNQTSATTLLVAPLKSPPDSVSTRVEDIVTTLLEVNAPDGTALGDVQVNGQPLFTLTGAGRYEYRFVGAAGVNVLEAHITMPPEVAARWHFDFRRAEHFEAGSIEVSGGQVLSQDAHSIVFQLDGATQSRLTFRFRLEP